MLSHFRSSEAVPKSGWKNLLLRRKLLFYTKGRGAIFSLHFFNTVFFFPCVVTHRSETRP